MTATIDDVRAFWNSNPLWTGESRFEVGSEEFFKEHSQTYYDDVFLGPVDPRFFMASKTDPMLDLGCGIGFWLCEFGGRGFTDITGADLSPRSLELAGKRCGYEGVTVRLVEANAEELPFDVGAFAHINCSGVVHHTVNPPAAMSEIHRVLRPGGTACVGVY